MVIARRFLGFTLLGLAAAGTSACGLLDSGATEDVRVTMQQSDAALSPAMSGWSASVVGGDGGAAVISKDMVQSLVVLVTDIQFLPKEDEANADDNGAWVSLELAEPVEIDLMTLPTEGQSPIVIASGSVPVGNYGEVRLFFESATIVFTQDINLGVAFSFEAGEPGYPVEIPSGAETGIKTDAEFTVEAETNVNLLFNPTATFLNVTGTGDGRVILAPVIRSLPEGA